MLIPEPWRVKMLRIYHNLHTLPYAASDWLKRMENNYPMLQVLPIMYKLGKYALHIHSYEDSNFHYLNLLTLKSLKLR